MKPTLGARPRVQPGIRPQGQGMTTSAGLRPVIDRPLKPGREMIAFTPELRAELRAKLDEGLAALKLDATDAQRNSLIESLAFLSEWNAVINLTAIRNPHDMLVQHILDSLAVIPFLPAANDSSLVTRHSSLKLLDVGSGGGFPALPIAVMRPDIDVVSIDAVRKKTDYVNKAAQHLQLANLSAIHSRVEEHKASYDIVISRAFASLTDFVTWAGPRVGDQTRGAVMLAMKGKHPDDEIAALPKGWRVVHKEKLNVPMLDAERCLLWLSRAKDE